MFKIYVHKVLKSDRDTVFDYLSDHGNYKQFPGIDGSEVLQAHGDKGRAEGTLRKIVSGPFTLYERVTKYEKPYRLHYMIEKTFPFAMKHERGEISIHDLNGKQVSVVWISEGRVRVPIIGRALDALVQNRATINFHKILDYIENQS